MRLHKQMLINNLAGPHIRILIFGEQCSSQLVSFGRLRHPLDTSSQRWSRVLHARAHVYELGSGQAGVRSSAEGWWRAGRAQPGTVDDALASGPRMTWVWWVPAWRGRCSALKRRGSSRRPSHHHPAPTGLLLQGLHASSPLLLPYTLGTYRYNGWPLCESFQVP